MFMEHLELILKFQLDLSKFNQMVYINQCKLMKMTWKHQDKFKVIQSDKHQHYRMKLKLECHAQLVWNSNKPKMLNPHIKLIYLIISKKIKKLQKI